VCVDGENETKHVYIYILCDEVFKNMKVIVNTSIIIVFDYVISSFVSVTNRLV